MTDPTWESDDGEVKLWLGDCLEVLPRLEPGSVDACITDPPYSSGGFTRGDRTQDVAAKYVRSGVEIIRGSFTGDNRDGRAWCYWMALWLSETHRLVRTSGKCLVFSDWRQLPLATDAIQSGGFVWRGIVAWDKGLSSRAPHKGYFRHQCEYIVWATSGVSVADEHDGPYPGCIQSPVLQADKHHITGKPTRLMMQLIRVVKEESIILDPFMGSGTTGVACVRTGRKFVGIEKDPAYFAIAVDRIKRELAQPRLPGLDEPTRCTLTPQPSSLTPQA